MLQRSALHDYQRATVDFIVNKRKCACWLSLGLGKTVGAATAVSDLIDSFQAQRTLIVAPKLVSRFSWTNELANWEQLGHMSITTRDQMVGVKSVPSPTRRSEEEEKYIDTKWIARECRMILKEDHEHCNGNTAKLYRNTTTWIRNFHRDRLLEFDTDISIINVENFQWLVETMRGAWPWDTIIMDESAMFRTPGSGRFKAYTDIAHKIDNLIELTATPAPNGYLGLWAQIFMIDGGKRLGRTYTAFRDNFFIQSFNGYSYNLRPGMKDVIDDKIKDVVISMDAGDHLELQPEVIEDIVLTLPNKLRPLYDELAKEFYLSLPDGEVDVETMAILSSKLRQFCSGSMYSSDEDRTVIDVHNMKVDALRDITEATGGVPMIMVYDFKPEKAKIIKAFSNRSIVLRTSNDFDQDEWDAGLVDYLLLHPKSGGHGLNLQHGTNLMAHSSLTWDLELYQQINGRMNPTRQFQSGYNRPSVYYRVYFRDTVESNVVVPMLADKAATQKSLLEAVKYNLRSEYG